MGSRPRDPRGVRHSLTPLLGTAVAAVLTGATSLAAIGEWIADVPETVLAALQVRYDPLRRRYEVPDESTIRQVLEGLDAAVFAATASSWLNDLATARTEAGQAAARTPGRRWRSLAVDGKALRGTWHHTGSGRAVHLLAVTGSRTLTVLGQVQVNGKSNELTAFVPLLEPLDLTGAVVTADALRTSASMPSSCASGRRRTTSSR
jgi:hypothetical protein